MSVSNAGNRADTLVSSSNSLLPPILHQSVIFSHQKNNNYKDIKVKNHCKVNTHMNLNN